MQDNAKIQEESLELLDNTNTLDSAYSIKYHHPELPSERKKNNNRDLPVDEAGKSIKTAGGVIDQAELDNQIKSIVDTLRHQVKLRPIKMNQLASTFA